MKLFRNILFFIVLIGGSIAKGQNLAVYDNSKPVVLLQPLDMLRVKQIEAMLPEKPSGFGETYKNRKEWNRLLNTRKYDKLLKSADSSLTEPFPAWSDTDYLAYWTKGTSVPGKNMHIALPIGKHNVLMANDVPEFMGKVNENEHRSKISINTESKDEADKLFNGLSVGGTIEMPITDSPWGSYFGMFRDKYGIEWMVEFNPTPLIPSLP